EADNQDRRLQLVALVREVSNPEGERTSDGPEGNFQPASSADDLRCARAIARDHLHESTTLAPVCQEKGETVEGGGEVDRAKVLRTQEPAEKGRNEDADGHDSDLSCHEQRGVLDEETRRLLVGGVPFALFLL